MDTKTHYTLAALVRVDAVLDEHAADFPDTAQSAARHELPGLVSRMREQGAVQRECTIQARGETEVQRVTRLDIRRRYLVPVAKVAKVRLHDVPHFADLTLPPSRLKGSKFVAAVRATASAASQYTDVFVANGLAADFVAKMTEAANMIERSLAQRDSLRLLVMESTAKARTDVRRGGTLLGMLDALVRAELMDNSVLLTKWNGARRVSKKPGTPTGAPVPAVKAAA